MATQTRSDRPAQLARLIGEHATALAVQVAVAESLTGGLLGSALAHAPGASRWYAGGIVPCARHVKHGVLDVPPGPVVSSEATMAMAVAGARLMSAEYAVSLTGVSGPDPQDGQPPGTVYLAICTPDGVRARQLCLRGRPHEIAREAVAVALAELNRELRIAVGDLILRQTSSRFTSVLGATKR